MVLEEVDSYRDTPIEAIYDDFEDMVFAGNPMGHNILGCDESIARIESDDCLHYIKTQYVPANMAFFSVGPAQPDKVFALAQKHLGAMHHQLDRAPRQQPPVLARDCLLYTSPSPRD